MKRMSTFETDEHLQLLKRLTRYFIGSRIALHTRGDICQISRMPSKNRITIDQLSAACRHVEELQTLGVTENLAIRTLELFADVYAKLQVMGNANPHSAREVRLWSKAALELKSARPRAKASVCFRVEHGTPRRAFARKVMEKYNAGMLTERTMRLLVKKYWRLAVITLEEDTRLDRSGCFGSPEERWAAARIKFPRKRVRT